MTESPEDPEAVIITGVIDRMAIDGPLYETAQRCAAGAVFSTAGARVRLTERTVARLVGRRLLHVEGEPPSRIATLTQ